MRHSPRFSRPPPTRPKQDRHKVPSFLRRDAEFSHQKCLYALRPQELHIVISAAARRFELKRQEGATAALHGHPFRSLDHLDQSSIQFPRIALPELPLAL